MNSNQHEKSLYVFVIIQDMKLNEKWYNKIQINHFHMKKNTQVYFLTQK